MERLRNFFKEKAVRVRRSRCIASNRTLRSKLSRLQNGFDQCDGRAHPYAFPVTPGPSYDVSLDGVTFYAATAPSGPVAAPGDEGGAVP